MSNRVVTRRRSRSEAFARRAGQEPLAGPGAKAPLPDGLCELEALGTELIIAAAAYQHRCRALGRAKGRVEGKAEALVCLLVERFGTLPPALHKRIGRAKLATLDRWLERAVVASDVPSVFDPPRRERRSRRSKEAGL